jgi:hypothetical protein
MATVPAELENSKKVLLLQAGKDEMIALANAMKAAGFDGHAIGGALIGMGTAIGGAFGAYGAADSAAIVTFKENKRKK